MSWPTGSKARSVVILDDAARLLMTLRLSVVTETCPDTRNSLPVF